MQRLIDRADVITEAYGLVLLLTIATFVTLSLLPNEDWARMAGVAMAGFTAVVGLTSSNVRGNRLRNAIFVALLAVAMSGLAVGLDARLIGVVSITLISGLMFITLGTILKRVVMAPTVDFRTILGALTAYTMLGIIFSYVYVATALIQNQPFFIQSSDSRLGDYIFFSYTTLTTTGYGNLLPDGQPGESLAVIEMLMGQIFLVTLIARLVSLWEPGARRRQLEDTGPS